MENEKQNEEQEEEVKEVKKDVVKIGKKGSVLDEANEVYKKLEEQNQKFQELLERQEELMARQMLRGRSDATVEETKKKEESALDYKNRIMRGEL
jgi:hypothetical protein